MKYIFLLGLLGITLLASFLIAFDLTKNKAIALLFKRLNEYVFLFITSGVTIFPFSHLDLASLGSREKGFLSGALLVCVYGAVFVLLRIRIAQILNHIIILFQPKYFRFYLALILFSALWSITPLLTLRGGIALALIGGFAVYFAKAYSWQQNFQLLRWNQIIITCFSMFMALFFPTLAQTEKGWGGAIGHPIDLGNMMALTASLWLLHAIHHQKHRWLSFLFCVFSIIVMQLANSAGAFVIFLSLIVIIFVASLFKKLKFFQAYILFASVLSILTIPSIWLLGNLENILSLLDKDLSFTGRVPLWNLLIKNQILERLWFGYGYSGFWQPWKRLDNPAALIPRAVGDWAVHAHNGVIDIILSVGLVGFILFALSFLINIERAIKLIISDRQSASFLPLIVLSYVFISNLFHSPIMNPGYVWFLYVLVTVKLQDVDNKSHQNLI
ncbi:MAG: O-antigen ligase family protein [Cyanobacteria bacterium P01_A01_bin.83]